MFCGYDYEKNLVNKMEANFKIQIASLTKQFEVAASEISRDDFTDPTAEAYIATIHATIDNLNNDPSAATITQASATMLFLAGFLEQKKLAGTDLLTGLANKTSIIDSIDGMIARSQRSNGSVGVFYIDLTNFKPINDKLSHIDGDKALVLVADKLKDLMREGDIVGRDGGDEFVIAISHSLKENDFKTEQARITKLLDDGITYITDDGDEYPIGGDVGLAIAEEGEKAVALIERADYIMKIAKKISHSKLEEENNVPLAPS